MINITSEDKIRKYKDIPDVREYVIATITEINPNSAFAVLDEYNNKKAMIHISEISSSWVKDIKKFVKEGQKVVAEVIRLDNRGYIELSLKRVKPTIAREKIKEFRNEKKAHNFLKLIGNELGINIEDMYKKVGFPLQKEFGSMYAGFEIVLDEGIDSLIKIGIDKKIAEKMYAIASEYIKPKQLIIKGELEIIIYESEGIEIIKKALDLTDGVNIYYVSAPKYRLEIIGEDYKTMEKKLKEVLKKIEDRLKGHQYIFSFERIKG